jgi:hypothetical protein
MDCTRAARDARPLEVSVPARVEYCPLHDVVLVVRWTPRIGALENIALCGELSARGDVAGLVWFGEPSPAALVALQQLAQSVPWGVTDLGS